MQRGDATAGGTLRHDQLEKCVGEGNRRNGVIGRAGRATHRAEIHLHAHRRIGHRPRHRRHACAIDDHGDGIAPLRPAHADVATQPDFRRQRVQIQNRCRCNGVLSGQGVRPQQDQYARHHADAIRAAAHATPLPADSPRRSSSAACTDAAGSCRPKSNACDWDRPSAETADSPPPAR